MDDALSFRRALPADKAAVEALCAKIWEGDDYVPRCFDDWAADTAGELTLCFAGDRLAGLSKLSWQGPGEAWLEGLRKDPDVPVKGVGKALCQRYLQRLAETEGLRSVRFSTYFQNHASIRLNEALGFRRVATASLKVLEGEALARRRTEPSNPRLSILRDPEAVLAFVRASGWFGPFIHQAWHSYPWSEAFFTERYVAPGRCLGLVEDGRIKALAAFLVQPLKDEGSVPFFDAEDAASASTLLAEVERRLAAQNAREGGLFIPPGGARTKALVEPLGWHSFEREDDYLVYELPLARLADYRSGSISPT